MLQKSFLKGFVDRMTRWWTGAIAGSLHAVSGPDHLAALLPLALTRGYMAFREGAVCPFIFVCDVYIFSCLN